MDEKITMSMNMTMEDVRRAPPPCADSNTFSCTEAACDYCHDDGEDGGDLYCEYRDTHFVF